MDALSVFSKPKMFYNEHHIELVGKSVSYNVCLSHLNCY